MISTTMNNTSSSKRFLSEETSDLFWQALDESIALVLVNEKGQITYTNKSFLIVTGLSENDVNVNITELIDVNNHHEGIKNEIFNQINSGKSWKRRLWLRFKKHKSLCFKVAFYPYSGHQQPIQHLIIFFPENNSTANSGHEFGNDIKDFSHWAHDLRNPLYNLSALSGLLLDTPLNEQQKEYVRKMKHTAGILSGMIDDLLLTCLESKPELKPFSKPFELKKTVEEFSQYYARRAEEKGVQTGLEVDASLPDCVYGDQRRLNQVIIYLTEFLLSLHNTRSIRITALTEEADAENCEVSFFVLGQLSPSDETLEQQDDEDQKAFSLTMEKVRHNVELLNGNILLQEINPKAFYFHFLINFPLNPIKEKNQEIEEPFLDEAAFPENAKILVAEDVELNQMVMKHQLQKIGLDADFVRSGFNVLEKLKIIQYDLIIMDVQMPGLDGLQTIEAIRAERATPYHSIPIIGITASIGGNARAKCLEAGANDFVPKPFELGDLKSKVKKLIIDHRKKPRREMKTKHTERIKPKEEKYYNLEYLEEISEGDQEFSVTMISYFVENTPKVLSALKENFHNQEWDEIRQIAHKLKPQVIYMGIQQIADDVEQVEQHANQRENLDQIWPKVQNIEKICLMAIEQLKEVVEKIQNP